MLKAGKLERHVYLRLAAQVTVGFQKRLADCRAAERFEHDLRVQEAVDAAASDLQQATLPMKTYDVVEAGMFKVTKEADSRVTVGVCRV